MMLNEAPLQRVEHNLVLDTREAKQKVVSARETILAAAWPTPALRILRILPNPPPLAAERHQQMQDPAVLAGEKAKKPEKAEIKM